jgi:membrane protease YdiL (CAAX protease family)
VFRSINWNAFGFLLVGGLVGVVAVLPLMAAMIDSLPPDKFPPPEIPLPLIVLLALVQNAVILSMAVIVGMAMAKLSGLEFPIVMAWAERRPLPPVKPIVASGLLIGAAVGIALVLLEAVFFIQKLPASMLPIFDIPLWKRLLAGVVYGGITEEILMRLFLVSLFVWLLGRWWRARGNMPASGVFWTAIVVVAVIFGLGHLPATAAFAPLTPTLITRAIVLNGVAGLAFGWLYWRRGLESAMIAHATAHLIMQIPGVMLLKTLI